MRGLGPTLVLLALSLGASSITHDVRAETPPELVGPPEPVDPNAPGSPGTPGSPGSKDLELAFHIEIGGGSILKWSAFDETGNTFGGLVLVRLRELEIGLGAAVVLPDSRLQADFATFWLEGRYHILGEPQPLALSPYILAGLGVTLADGFEPLPTGFIPARWSREANLAVHLGAGLRWGQTSGMYVAAEVRALNHTHLGLQLLVGVAFP